LYFVDRRAGLFAGLRPGSIGKQSITPAATLHAKLFSHPLPPPRSGFVQPDHCSQRGWPPQFRIRGSRHWPGVAEFFHSAKESTMKSTIQQCNARLRDDVFRIAFLFCCVACNNSLAYFAPLQATEAWVEQNGSASVVRFRVYDPVHGTWIADNSGSVVVDSVSLNHKPGVVAWLTTKSGTTRTVNYRIYDPIAGHWVGSGLAFTSDSVTLLNQDGVVAWLTTKSTTTRTVNYRIYDPIAGN
jgi:hypothetical protein